MWLGGSGRKRKKTPNRTAFGASFSLLGAGGRECGMGGKTDGELTWNWTCTGRIEEGGGLFVDRMTTSLLACMSIKRQMS